MPYHTSSTVIGTPAEHGAVTRLPPGKSKQSSHVSCSMHLPHHIDFGLLLKGWDPKWIKPNRKEGASTVFHDNAPSQTSLWTANLEMAFIRSQHTWQNWSSSLAHLTSGCSSGQIPRQPVRGKEKRGRKENKQSNTMKTASILKVSKWPIISVHLCFSHQPPDCSVNKDA